VVLTKSDSLLLCAEEYVYIQGTSKIFEITEFDIFCALAQIPDALRECSFSRMSW
jgi:hypothetical protein